MKKKLLTLILAFAMVLGVFGLSACDSNLGEASTEAGETADGVTTGGGKESTGNSSSSDTAASGTESEKNTVITSATNDKEPPIDAEADAPEFEPETEAAPETQVVVEGGNDDSRETSDASSETAFSEMLEFSLNDDGSSYTVSGARSSTGTHIIIPSQFKGYKVTAISDRAFFYDNIVSVVIPDTVETIGEEAFWYCRSLQSVTMGSNVSEIRSGAFQGCESLTTIELPESLTRIGMGAFWGCTNLKSVTVSDTPAEKPMRKKAFASTSTVEEYATDICTEITSDFLESESYCMDSATDCEETEKQPFPTGPKFYDDREKNPSGVGERAFEDCTKLTSVALPNSLTGICTYAFNNCTSLTDITLSDKLTHIDSFAFLGSSSLTNITLPNGLTDIGGCAFSNCKSLKSIDIPSSVITIGNSAFSRCTSLGSVTLHDGLTRIKAFAFMGCYNLKTINIPLSITVIETQAFTGCDSLENITFANVDDWRAVGLGSKVVKITGLSDTSVAAQYLTATYCEFQWTTKSPDVTLTETNQVWWD